VETLRVVYPDGGEDMLCEPSGEEEPSAKLCGPCPYGPGGLKPPIHTVEVVRTVRAVGP
jgi:hypothetical protein